MVVGTYANGNKRAFVVVAENNNKAIQNLLQHNHGKHATAICDCSYFKYKTQNTDYPIRPDEAQRIEIDN